jgi:hypothetical protein
VTVEAPPPPEPAVATVEVSAPAPEVEVAYVEPTAFVSISPEVQVIENYDYPVFFYGGMYWRNEGGLWYSSSYHDRGWITVNEVPTHIRTIERPAQYSHFHANVNARPGQIGYRAAVTAPIHHSAPPPRGIEHPGHPVAPMHPAGGPPGHAVAPAHPAGPPPGHPVEAAHPAAPPPGHPVEAAHPAAPPPAAHPVAPAAHAPAPAPAPHPAAPAHPSTPTKKK